MPLAQDLTIEQILREESIVASFSHFPRSDLKEQVTKLIESLFNKLGIEVDHSLPKTTPPGSLHLDWTVCGKPTCRCARGILHGPYVYRRWREGLKQRKAYVPVGELQRVMAEMEAKRAIMPKPTEMRRMLKELNHAQ